MSPQTVWKVELRELSVIEIVCSRCRGASVSIPLTGIANFPRFMKCPGCNETWWDRIDDPIFREIAGMVQSIDNLKRAGSKLFTLQFPVVGVNSEHEAKAQNA